MTTPARTLPVPLPPLHRELLGSYLHRLADANHLTIRGLSHEIGRLPDVQRERGGVIGDERVRDMRNPAGRPPGGVAAHGVGGVLILSR
jgi:hypothetical protein